MSQITVKELKEALANMKDDAVIEIAVSSRNRVYPVYIPLEKSIGWDTIVSEAPYSTTTVRLHSSLPQDNEKYTIFVERKNK